MPLVMSAKELLFSPNSPLFIKLPAEQEQMLLRWLHVQDNQLLPTPQRLADFEEFPRFVPLDIQDKLWRGFTVPPKLAWTPVRSILDHPDPGPHLRKISLQITAHFSFPLYGCLSSRKMVTARNTLSWPSNTALGQRTTRFVFVPFPFLLKFKNCWP